MSKLNQMRRATLLATGLLAACTDASLEPLQTSGPAIADDKLAVTAHVCTSAAVDDFFPVKMLFLVDTSDSMSVTDRGGTRAQAVVEVLNRYAGNPSVSFGVIAFDSKIDVLTNGFTNSPDIAKISSRLSMADRLTDYQGVLGAAYAMLSADMLATAGAQRPRTKYVVIFFSDGTPDPQCSAKGGSPYLICSVPREQWKDAFDPPLDPSLYPELTAGGDYNQPEQIFQKVDQIVALQDFYHVGEVRLHTGFLFDPKAASDPLALPFHLDRVAGEKLLTDLAMHGHGTFTEFDSATKISFLNFNYSAIKAEYALANFFATDSNTLADLPSPIVDTDGDGLSDDEEFTLHTCVGPSAKCKDPTDTDGDGYSDFLEARNLRAGFDPLDRARPAQKCAALGDSDGDGLRDCEELILGTDPRLFDSDADRISDLVEVRAGLDPLDPDDALADPDHDGVRSIDEVRAHTNPLVADQDIGVRDNRYSYEVLGTTIEPGDVTCYDLAVHNVRLLTTGGGTDAPIGKNRIYLNFVESLRDRPSDYGLLRTACVDVRYVDGAFKSPPSGQVALDDKAFIAAARRKASDCIDLTAFATSPDGGVPDGGGGGDGGPDGGAGH